MRIRRAFLLFKTFISSEIIFSRGHTDSLFMKSSCEGDCGLCNELHFYDCSSEQSRATKP